MQGTCTIDIRIVALEPLLSTILGIFRASHVNFFSTLRRLREDGDTVRQHFGKTPRNRKITRLSILPIAELADRQCGYQRRATRQYAKRSVLSRNLHFFCPATNHQSVWSNYLEFESVRHQLDR